MANKFFQKEVKNPFFGNRIKVYADLPSASFFHNGLLIPILDGIRTTRNDEILSEDNRIEIYLRAVASNSFRITYRLSSDDPVHALIMNIDGPELTLYQDPLI